MISSVLLLASAAWLALWLSEDFTHSLLHLHSLDHHASTSGGTIFLFIGGWTVMTVAMMLPTSLPVITIFHTFAGNRRDRSLLIILLIAGYLGVWVLFGTIVYAVYVLLQRLVTSSTLLTSHVWLAGPSILILAGAFQFSDIKYRCLDKCRSPLSFVIEHWQGHNEKGNALRLGVDHGIFCVGCCWALMLLMFVVGFGSIGWMFILAAIMATEKNFPWGRQISAPLGVILIGLGLILVLTS